MKWLEIVAIVALPVCCLASNDGTSYSKHSPLPLVFEANSGQAPSGYQFVSHSGGLEALFSRNNIDLLLPGGPSKARVRLQFAGSRPNVMPEGRNPLPSVSNYLLGNDSSRWIRGISNLSAIEYSQIYPGIDLLFHGNQDAMEHDFRIEAHARVDQVRFMIEGASGITLDPAGNLEVSTDGGTLTFHKPLAYQESQNGRKTIDAAFVLTGKNSVRFKIAKYNHDRELVIDPVFSFSTYLAGSSADYPAAVTTDAAGNVYVTGYTYSPDFPLQNALETTAKGSPNVFVSKLDPTGQTLLYSTYIGGSSRNYANAIAVDPKGNIIVAGTSSSNDFPHAGSVPSLTCEGNNDCFFLFSLKPNGSAFNYAGLIGGIEGTDVASGQSGSGTLAIDGLGNAYLAGVTDDANFKITAGTLASSVPGYPYNSTFVLKASPLGALVYSTIIPGTEAPNSIPYVNVFIPTGISIDATGEVTIAGTAGPGLPSSAGVVQPTFPNNLTTSSPTAGFVLQLNATASAIKYATYLRGTDSVGGLAVDSHGNSYVTGGTNETNLPVGVNAYQKTIKAGDNCICNSGFIVKLNPLGTAVLAATYLEGTPASGNEGTDFTGIALDANSNVFVGGMTASTDFPMKNPFVSFWVYGASVWDMVIAEMSPDLSTLKLGTFLSSTDQIFPASQFRAMAVDNKNNPIVVGNTSTTDFPTTAGVFQRTPPSQAYHAFITKFNMAVAAPSVCLDNWNVNFGQVPAKTSSTQTVHLTNCGNAPLNVTTLFSSASTVVAKETCGTISAGVVCPISVSYKPLDSSAVSGTITLSDNTVISPQIFQFSGQGVAPRLSPSSGSIDFGHLLVNTVGTTNQLFFQNNGNAPLNISSASVNGNFAITQNGCVGTQYPGYFCVISVRFSPLATGIRTGTLTINSNDPVYPHAGISLVGTGDSFYGIPIISSLSSPSVQIGNGPITFYVYGAHFYPASVVQVNGVVQPTTYVNEGELQATLDALASSAIGEVAVRVVNPTPGGGTSVGTTLTRYNVVNLNAAFLAAPPGSGLVYASIPSSATIDPNTVVPITPTTGILGKPIPVGNNPSLLAASGDGHYLFVVANGAQTVQRINVFTKTVDRTFPFPANNCNYCGTLSASDIKAVPGSPQEVLVSFLGYGNFNGEIALYNDTGLVNYVPTGADTSLIPESFALAGNPLTIYSLPFTIVQNPFFNSVTIGTAGLQYTPPGLGNYGGNNTTGAQVVSDGTLLYTNSGEVWSPATKTQVGSFPVTTYNATSYPNLHSLIMDAASGHIFVIGDQPYGGSSASMVLSAYGQKSLALTGALALPQVQQPEATSLIRWGSSGFAFLASGVDPFGQQVFLLTTSLVGAVTSNPLPHVSLVTPGGAPQGSSDVFLTINGQGFTESSVVSWNGAPLQTTYVGKTVLNADIPASDLATSGTASITVNTPAPGGGVSNVIHFTIAAPTPLISFSASALNFAARTVGTSSSAQTIAVENPGTATLTISAIGITGTGATSFHQTHTCGSTLAAGANCNISVTFKPSVAGSLGALLSITDNATGSPQTIQLSGTGN
jgi:hypothetical protein